MKTDIKELWTTALRSGDYKQAAGRLYASEIKGYCCLGVLCELAVEAGVIEPRKDTVYGNVIYASFFDGNELDLPVSVREWAGLEDADPLLSAEAGVYVDDEGDEFSYAGVRASFANDTLGWDFNKIADAIDANIAGE